MNSFFDGNSQSQPFFTSAPGPYTGPESKSHTKVDSRILQEMCTALRQHPDVDASDIHVDVENGTVILSGRVSSVEMKETADELAAATVGEKFVKSKLAVVDEDEQRLQTTLATGVY